MHQRAADSRAPLTLSDVFNEHYRPTCLVGAAQETRREYQRVIRRWADVTGDPPLADIKNSTVASFYEALLEYPNKTGGRLSVNTVRKHARHLQPVLDITGPPSRDRRDGLGLLAQVPWARPPRSTQDVRPAMPPDDVSAMYRVADRAVYPYDERTGVRTADWWRAALVLCWNTGLRIGTMIRLADDDVRWGERVIVVSGTLAPKTGKAQVVPIGDVVLRHLLLLRGAKAALLAWPHRSVRMYDEFHRLRTLAHLPERRGVAWHAIRRAHATLLARRSSSAAQMSLGHSSFKTTMAHYVQPEVLREAIDALPQPAAFLGLPGSGPQQLKMF